MAVPLNEHLICIAATFTADPIGLPLQSWIGWLNWTARVQTAPYNQLFQQLLDPNSAFASNRGGTNVLMLRMADWYREDAPEELDQHLSEFLGTLDAFSPNSSSPLIVVLCPSGTGSQESSRKDDSRVDFCEQQLADSLRTRRHVHLITATDIATHYPVESVGDATMLRTAHIPYNQRYFTAIASELVRQIDTLQRAPRKVVVLDCDQTLWDGVCGEDGPSGVRITPERRALQQQMLRLQQAGMLLCLCSKNEPADVWSVFEHNPDMLLKRNDITAARINWEPKSSNLRSLAAELRLGSDSFIFIDDNPVECAEVQSNCPEVLTLQLPQTNMVDFLAHVWAFDTNRVSDEDHLRAGRYAQELQREDSRKQAASFEEFLNSLQLQIEIEPMQAADIDRVSQLTQRTNQFNFTTIRRTPHEIETLDSASGHRVLVVRARDRFGDYGLVGTLIYHVETDALIVDTLLLSCRALGRRIEHRMIDRLMDTARWAGLSEIELRLVPTQKNSPAQSFFHSLCGTKNSNDLSDAVAVRLPLNQLADHLSKALDSSHSGPEHASEPRTESSTPTTFSMSDHRVQSIALELNSIEKIQARIASERQERPDLDQALVPPLSAIEEQVTAICCEVMHMAQIGLDDPLKSLGISSLHVVQIHGRLTDECRAELSITDLFTLPTVRAIVNRIELPGGMEGPDASQGASPNRGPSRGPNRRPSGRESTMRVRGSDRDHHGAIAVVGMAGRFPGAADVQELWSNLVSGICSIVDLEDSQLDLPADSPLRKNPNLVKRGAALADVDKFDASFFGIFPKEAQVMDPQHRIMLECCWHALEDGGYIPDAIAEPVGLFAGCYMDTYILASLASHPKLLESLANSFHGGDLHTELGNDKDYLATRVSYMLNLRGPAMTVQTACSTSLVAIAQACQSLMAGQCQMALAGGVTLKLPQNRGYLYAEGGMVSPEGEVRTFDAKARGTVFGEGAGVVLLKRLEDAIADGNEIYGVLRGWGINNDGRAKMGYTAPSVVGQSEAIESAHRMAGIDADTIGYVEAHGTGTSLGDPIEIDALTRAFRRTSDKKQYCAIGSLKTNIGHLDVAAGVSGLIKVCLAMENEQIPPSLNFVTPNPNIDFPNSPFFVNTQLRDWPRSDSVRRAGLSSFGVGGTNVHVVIEEPPSITAVRSRREHYLLTLSARSAAALQQLSARLADYLERHPNVDLDDVAYTLQTGRKTFNYTRAIVGHCAQDVVQRLRSDADEKQSVKRQIRRDVPSIWMFPGQGSQYLNMARQIYRSEPVFARAMDDCAQRLQPWLGHDIREAIFVDQPEAGPMKIPGTACGNAITTRSVSEGQHSEGQHLVPRLRFGLGFSSDQPEAGSDGLPDAAAALNRTEIAQPAIFATAYAYAQWLLAAGMRPAALIGHSIGEFVAACLGGVFSLDDALKLIVFRAKRMQQLPPGNMLAVRMPQQELQSVIDGLALQSSLAIAAVNSPEMVVVSGEKGVVEQLETHLQDREVACRSLHTSHAFHSAMMEPVIEPFAELIKSIELRPSQIPIISTVTGQPLTEAQACDPYYWARHLRETVYFSDAVATAMNEPNAAILVEVGPGQTLSTLAKQHPSCRAEHVVLSLSPHAKQPVSDAEQAWTTVGKIWQSGGAVDFAGIYADELRRRLHLPVYPFERQRFWFDQLSVQTSTESWDEECDKEDAIDPHEVEAEGTTAVQTSQTNPINQHVSMIQPPRQEPVSAEKIGDDDLVQRVIEQQLSLMTQQLQTWHSQF